MTVSAPPGLAGDFNEDNKVDAADYVVWRKNDGTNNGLPNDNGLGTPIGVAHFNLWRANFGEMAGSGSCEYSRSSGTDFPGVDDFRESWLARSSRAGEESFESNGDSYSSRLASV